PRNDGVMRSEGREAAGLGSRRRAPLDPLDGAGKRKDQPIAALQFAAQKDQRAAGAGDLGEALDELALADGVDELAGERDRHAWSLQDRGGVGEQAIVGERHEAAAMDVASAVEMLLFHPEGRADAAVILHPVPERPVIGLEIVAGPGPPARKFTFRADI